MYKVSLECFDYDSYNGWNTLTKCFCIIVNNIIHSYIICYCMQHFCFGICMHNFFLETHKLHVTFTNEILKNSRKKMYNTCII